MESQRTLTVVIAAYNEQAALPAIHQRLAAVLDTLALSTRVLYVDDGSRDDTWSDLEQAPGLVLQQLRNGSHVHLPRR